MEQKKKKRKTMQLSLIIICICLLAIIPLVYLIQNQAVTQVEEGKLRQMMEEF